MVFLIPLAVGIAGGLAAQQEGDAQASAADYNAETARQNAMLARRKGELDVIQIRRSGREILAEEQAGYAAAGVSQVGSPTDVRAASAAAIESDALTARYNGELKAIGFDRSAGLNDMQAENARAAGTLGLVTGILGGVAGAANVASGAAKGG